MIWKPGDLAATNKSCTLWANTDTNDETDQSYVEALAAGTTCIVIGSCYTDRDAYAMIVVKGSIGFIVRSGRPVQDQGPCIVVAPGDPTVSRFTYVIVGGIPCYVMTEELMKAP